ncbi:helix-turn-helix transcriptional regulator [Herbaspirillum sp. LeCh32-8]|uniref:helix-turn-helix domain-containing protein n=1 Tax=Herbaspirillum sp. LeCh32-8 TaxID=2821356 RepID=UPI001AE330D8|nr:AraC family transcriptional regulator [Herbaspirillum sp. LeCh32-8]MBP0597987.1 helix-turn-helix transcriptional regulator [Herbaspirillum sp. LeCh32-8]
MPSLDMNIHPARLSRPHACPHCRCAAPSLPEPASNGLSMSQEKAARDYILRRLPERFLIKDVARHCNLSSARFAHKFKKSLGVSCRTWIQEQRIILAISLFHFGRDDISQVAMDCGFFDQSHFNRVFKKLVGTSPGAWLRTAALRMASYKN